MKQFKKTLSMFLAIVMVFSLFPVSAFATDDGLDEEVAVEEVQEQELTAPAEDQVTQESAAEPTETEQSATQEEPTEDNAPAEEPESIAAEEELTGQDSASVEPSMDSTEATGTTTLASGTCDGSVTWSLDNNGKLTIDGAGAIPDYIETSEQP
jgi:outer membrane biosynthesis protein TonB